MNIFRTVALKEQLAHSGRAALRLLAWLRVGVAKSAKFLVAGRRRMAASGLAVCLLLTMLPAVSLPVAASTGLWNAAGTKTDNLIQTPTLPVKSGGKTLSTGEGSDKAGWQTHWDTQMKPAGWGSKGISGPDNALQVYATKAEDGSQTFAIRPVDGGDLKSDACLGGAGDTSQRASGVSYTVTLDSHAKELANNGDLVTNVSAEFYKQKNLTAYLNFTLEFFDENGKTLSAEGISPQTKNGLWRATVTADKDGIWVQWGELGGDDYVSRAVKMVEVPEGTASIRYWFCNKGIGNDRKAIKNLQANFVSTATHTHPSCGDYLCTEHENMEFSLWESNNSLPTEAGYYSLTQDVTLTSAWQPSNNIHLCLNGHTVTRTGSGTLISVASGGSLSLYDCAENSGKITGGADGVHVRNGGALVLYGGDITANGTGVRVGTTSSTGTGSFTMYGGKITNNGSETAGERGSGVLMHGGSFTMHDGEISGNRTGGARGAGVAVGNTMYDNKSHCTFTMHGGKITGNMVGQARGSAVSVGGATSGGNALYTFHMLGGEISGNGTHSTGQGDAVIVDKNGRFTMSGGKITGNKNGVFAEAGITTLSGTAFIDDNTNNNLRLFYDEANTSSPHRYLTVGEGGFDEGAGIGVAITEGHDYQISSGTKYSSVTDYASADDLNYIHPDAEDTVVVYQDGVLQLVSSAHAHGNLGFVEWASTTSLPDAAGNYCLVGDVRLSSTWNVPVGDTVLCLNGHNIIQTGDRDTINVVSDDAGQYPRTLTVYDCQDSGAITHTAGKKGSGVYIVNSAFAMYGGEISGNTNSYGGGICSSENTHIILGGTAKVINNTATYYGGGVYIPKNSDAPAMSPSLELRDNAVVSGNRSGASAFGAGICFNGVSLAVSGSPVVSGNYKGEGTDTENNIFVEKDKAITVGELSDGASIGVNTKNAPTSGRPVVFTDGAAAEYAEYFFADNSETYEIGVEDSGKLTMALTPVIEKYDLWVGGVQVTEENAGDILDNGTATYDAATNTLTLDNANITTAYLDSGDCYDGIYAAGDLTVALKGENSINVSAYDPSYAIGADGDLTIVKTQGADVPELFATGAEGAVSSYGNITYDGFTLAGSTAVNDAAASGSVVYEEGYFELSTGGAAKTLIFAVPAVHTHDNVTFDKEWTATSGTILAGNYYLTDDFAATGVLTVASGTEVNLCLNGHTLDLGSRYIYVQGTLNIYDCQGGEGAITSATSVDEEVIYNRGTVTLYSGKIVNTGATLCYGIYSVGGLTEIKGGRVDAAVGINNRSTSTLNVSGDAVITGSGNYGFAINNQGIVNVSGGEIVGGTFDGIYNTNKVTVTGGLVRSNVTSGICNSGSSSQIAELVVSGGTVQSGYNGSSGIRMESYSKTTISGNALIETASGGSEGIEAIGGEVYILGGTVKGGYAIKNEGANVYISGGTLIGSSYSVYNGSVAEITGGTITSKHSGVYNYGTGTVKITDGNITGTSYGIYNRGTGTVTVLGGTVKATNSDSYGVYNYSTGTIKVLDGEINGANYGIYNSDGTIEVAGGTLTGTNKNGIYSEGGYIYLSGTPTISGGDDIYRYSGEIYAHANGDINDAYEGGPLTVKIRSRFTDGVVVYEINDNNAEKFSLAEGSTQTLVRVGDNLIVDGTAPTLEIKEGTNVLNKVLNTITFGLFFKETKQITIVSDDNFSGVDKTYYFVSDRVLDEGELESVSWELYDGAFSLNPNTKSIIYAYTVDKAGNKSDIYGSDGIVIFTDTEITTGEYEYTLTTKDDIVTNIKPGENTVADVDICIQNGGLGSGLAYSINGDGYIVLDGEDLEEIVAGNGDTVWDITIAYNALGEVYGQDATGDKISDTALTLAVRKADGEVKNISNISKTYDGAAVSAPTYDRLGTGAVTVEYKGKDAPDSAYTATAPKDAGEYTVRVTAASDTTYKEAVATADFTIAKLAVTPPTVGSKVYTGDTQTADVTATALYAVTANVGGRDVGSYDVVLTLKDSANCVWDATEGVDGASITLTLHITKAVNEWTATPAMAGWTYGAAAEEPTGAAKFGEVTFAYFDSDKAPLGTKPTNAGDYFVKASVAADGGNYDAIATDFIPFRVAQKEIGLQWLLPTSFVFDGTAHTPTAAATGVVSGDSVHIRVALHSGDNCNAGSFTYQATGLDNANYTLPSNCISGVYTVMARLLVPGDFVANTGGLVYDGTAKQPTVQSVNSLVTADDYTVAYINNVNAGVNTATISITGKGNAVGTVEIDFTIAKATPTEIAWPTGLSADVDGRRLNAIDLSGYTNGGLGSFAWDNGDAVVKYGSNEYGITYRPSDSNNYNPVSQTVAVVGKDVTAPTGTLTVGVDSWDAFWNNVTFGLFFKNTQKVTVASADAESGVSKTEYYLAAAETSDFAGVSWTVFEDEFNINPNNAYVVYVKITDNAGNAAIINSDGVVLDDRAPVISGITDGSSYHKEVEVTVADANLDRVEVNGVPVTVAAGGKCKLTASADKQTVKAFDKAGNESAAITVTVEAEHRFVWGEWYDNHNGTHSKAAHCACGAALTVTAPKDGDVVADGLEEEAVTRGKDLHLVIETNVDNIDAGAMAAIKAELGKGIAAVYIDITVKDAVSGTPITDTVNVLEIPVAFAFADKLNVVVYRNHEGVVECLRALDAKPESAFENGTYYLDRENDRIYIYSNQFSTYGVAYHTHSLTNVPKKDATPEADGNIAYWYCEGCDKCFADAEGKNEIAKSETVAEYVQSPQTGDSRVWLWLLICASGLWLAYIGHRLCRRKSDAI